MVLTLMPFVVICLIVAGIAGSCAFRPGGPSVGAIPQYDASLAVGSQAKQLDFPLRLPETPEGWSTNSGGTIDAQGASGEKIVNVGYITDRTTYLQLAQSNLPAELLQEYTAAGARTMTGEEAVGELVWAVFSQGGAEAVWVAQLPSSSVSITGSGSPAEFATLAAAYGQAQTLPSS